MTPKTDEILEGENATFECKSTAKPPLDTVWKRSTPTCVPDSCTDIESILESNGRLIIEGGKLTIINALPEDKGKYECKASLGSVFDASVVTLNVTGTWKPTKQSLFKISNSYSVTRHERLC